MQGRREVCKSGKLQAKRQKISILNYHVTTIYLRFRLLHLIKLIPNRRQLPYRLNPIAKIKAGLMCYYTAATIMNLYDIVARLHVLGNSKVLTLQES